MKGRRLQGRKSDVFICCLLSFFDLCADEANFKILSDFFLLEKRKEEQKEPNKV